MHSAPEYVYCTRTLHTLKTHSVRRRRRRRWHVMVHLFLYSLMAVVYSFYDCQQRIANIKNSTKRNQYFSHTKHARQLKLKLFFPLTYTNTCVSVYKFLLLHTQTHSYGKCIKIVSYLYKAI